MKEATSSLQTFRVTTLSTDYLNIASLTGLEYCTNLYYLCLNHINDVSPLVENEGLGTGGLVNLQVNPLNSDS